MFSAKNPAISSAAGGDEMPNLLNTTLIIQDKHIIMSVVLWY